LTKYAVEKLHGGHRTGGTGNLSNVTLAKRPRAVSGEFYESNVYERIVNCTTGCFFYERRRREEERPGKPLVFQYLFVCSIIILGRIACITIDAGFCCRHSSVSVCVSVCLSVCLSVGYVYEPYKMSEPMEMPFREGGADSGWPNEPCIS